MNSFGYVDGNPLFYTDTRGLHHDGAGCVDPRGNRVPCPRDICNTSGECVVGKPPVLPEVSQCKRCQNDCVVRFASPVPDIGSASGSIAGTVAEESGRLIDETAAKAGKHVVQRFTVGLGVYDLLSCLQDCKKRACEKDSCEK